MRTPNIKEAEAFAISAHGAQKYGESPYEIHLLHVLSVLTQEGYAGDDVLVAAGWLHDVVEDTAVTSADIESKFGSKVSDIVARVSDELGSTRKERKLTTYPKIKGHREATIIKLCDRIANVEASGAAREKLNLYVNEHNEFKNHLFIPNLADVLWARLDELIKKGSEKLERPILNKQIACQKCGGQASSIEITLDYFFKYSGPGGSNGDFGSKITPGEAQDRIEALAEPIDSDKLKNQFYDRAGFCQHCHQFYCARCWSISSNGFGTCPSGHGQSLDPHWSPED